MRSSDQLWFALGAIMALLAVALGAFATHGLRARLPADNLAIFETAARYQMYHALALLAVAWAAQRWGGNLPSAAGVLFVVGIALFCGSLYALAVSGLRILGAVAPLGGLSFLVGWLCLVIAALRG